MITALNSKEVIKFEILNAIGQVILSGSFNEQAVVETSNFAPGVYIIKLKNGNSIEYKKIIKE